MYLLHRIRFLFSPDDGAGAGGEAGAEPSSDAPPTPAADGGGTPSPEAAAPAWAPSEDEWVETQQTLRQLAGFVQQIGQPQTQTQTYDEPGAVFDPFADNAGEQLQQILERNNQQMLQQIQGLIAPVAGFTEQQIAAEAEARALDIIGSVAERNQYGDLGDGAKFVRAAAEAEFAAAAARFGNTPRAAEHAIETAASGLMSWVKAREEAAVNAYKASLEQRSSVHGEPAGTGTAVSEPGAAETELQAVQRMFANRVAV